FPSNDGDGTWEPVQPPPPKNTDETSAADLTSVPQTNEAGDSGDVIGSSEAKGDIIGSSEAKGASEGSQASMALGDGTQAMVKSEESEADIKIELAETTASSTRSVTSKHPCSMLNEKT
ncbi:hypothetical protein ElyMa_004756300, partial [Elysia marginata]